MSHSFVQDGLTEEEVEGFERDGYIVARGMLQQDDMARLETAFTDLHSQGGKPGYYQYATEEEAAGDILKRYPRVMHPHRFMEIALEYLLYPRIMNSLAQLFGEEALAAQSMFYFKPPGARGQALHQDNYYLKVEPGTCIAAWVPIDPADTENGGLVVVPKTHHHDIECPHIADPSVSFTQDEVNVPEGMQPVPVNMAPGDVLFFNGSLIHGSFPNRSDTRFRRVFIGHYVGESTLRLGRFYNPLYTRAGEILQREDNTDAGPCGGAEIDGPH